MTAAYVLPVELLALLIAFVLLLTTEGLGAALAISVVNAVAAYVVSGRQAGSIVPRLQWAVASFFLTIIAFTWLAWRISGQASAVRQRR